MNQPFLKISIVNAISCSVMKLNDLNIKGIKNYFFYIKYLFNEDKVEMRSISSYRAEVCSNSRVVNFDEENKRIKGGKKMLLINSLKKVISNEDKDLMLKEKSSNNLEDFFDLNNTLVFSSTCKEIIYKWVCVINHFIKN